MPGGRLDDFSGTITTGGVSQLAVEHNVSRSLLFIQNVSAADLWVNFDTPATAAAPSVKLIPNATLTAAESWIPNGRVYVLGGTTGQAFVVKEA